MLKSNTVEVHQFHLFLSISVKGYSQVTSFMVAPLSLESFFVEPGPENRECGRILSQALVSSQGPIVISQGVSSQHDGQLEFDRFLHVAWGHHKLKSNI